MGMTKHLYIVISGDNANALGVVRSLGEAGIKPVLIYFVEQKQLPTLIKSRYLDVVHKVYSYEEGVDLLLRMYGSEDFKPFVYSCDDVIESIIDGRYEELKDHFYIFHACEQGRIRHLMNKKVICDIAESCGFRAPRNEVVKKGEMPKTLSYPIITKTLMSIIGAWKADSFICHSEEELREAYKKIKASDLLLEEYIDKKNELALEGFSVNEGEEVFVPYAISFLRLPNNAYGHYMRCTLTEDNDLLRRVKSIIRKCRFSGCFEVEFLVDKNDNLWFLEVNFRFSLWNYAVTFGGLNYPMMWAESTLANRIVPPEESSYASCPSRTSFTALDEPGDFSQSLLKKQISFRQWLSDIHQADMLYVYNPNDKLPAWSFWLNKMLRKISRKHK